MNFNYSIADTTKWPQPGYLSTVYGVKYIILVCENSYLELKPFALLYSFQY